jgi:hypothetical protein
MSLPKIALRTLGKEGREQQISICAMAFMHKKIVAFKRSFLNTRDGGRGLPFERASLSLECARDLPILGFGVVGRFLAFVSKIHFVLHNL